MLQWFTPREPGSPWVSKSADGYYGVGTPVMGQYGVYHFEGAFAAPKQFDVAYTISDAQELCEKHQGRSKSAAT
jgi:hypothetical protein